MKQSSKCAICAITAAVSLVIMILVAVIPFLTYVLPALSGAFITFIIIEIDKKWAFGIYACVSILSLLLVPDKEVAIMYLVFFGYYPIVKNIYEKIRFRPLAFFLKIITFLSTITLSYWLMIKFMGLQIDEFDEFGYAAIPLLLGIGLIAFILYDFVLSRLIVIYNIKWKKYFHKYFK